MKTKAPEELEEVLLKFHESRAKFHKEAMSDPYNINTALYCLHADLACFYRDRLGKWKEHREWIRNCDAH